MRIPRLSLIIASIFFSSYLLADSTDDSLVNALQGSWEIVEASNPDPGVSVGNVFILADNSFQVLSSSEKTISSGSWNVHEGRLRLDRGAEPDTSDIDSSSFIVESGTPIKF